METYDKEKDTYEEENILGSCENVLKKLANERIFNIYYHKQKSEFVIVEMCDEYFGIALTQEMCDDLSELFSKIAKHIKEN